jgi:putative nucleotidyltransferase with HDIG domain
VRERRSTSEAASPRGWFDREAILAAFMPERLLDGTPWLHVWREQETRSVVLSARIGLVVSAVGLVLHHFVVDVPLGLEPASLWAMYRFGSGAFYTSLLALTFIPALQRGRLARVVPMVLAVAIGCMQAKSVEWLPSVPYLYAFLVTLAAVLLLRQSAAVALATLSLCVVAQWFFAWRFTDVPAAKLLSGATLCAGLVVLFRGRMAADVRSFLTEKRELEAQKRLTETQIELDRVKTNFFTNVSHELRTPLTLILAPLEAMLSGERPTAPETRTELELMHRNAQRLLRHINALLDLSRLDAKHEFLRLEELDVVDLLRSLVESGRPLAAKKRVTLELVADGPVPPLPVDRDKFEKIVLNLLSNAIRFTDGTETRRGTIKVRCGVRDGWLRCAVEDSGIGMPEDQLQKIFDRFHQVDGPTERGRGGTGIGLALVKELTAFHAGRVSVTSRLGEGSTFTIEIPTARSAYPPERLDRRQEQLPTPVDRRRPEQRGQLELLLEGPRAAPRGVRLTPSPAGLRAAEAAKPLVLVVDDNREMLDFVSRQLASEFRIRTAEGAEEAHRLASIEAPAIVVSDVMMPGRSGTDLLRDFRSDPRLRHVPVILVTAKADLQSKIENLQEGADDYLAKPFNLAELRARIRSLLERRRLARDLAEKNEYLAKLNFDLVLSKRQVFLETMEAFALAVEAKDPYTHGHSRRVSILAERVAREMGLSEAECETVRIAGILHDVGKIGTPEAVLAKPGKVTPEEYEIFKRHSHMGWRIVSAVKELEGVARAILHHHERFEGGGYPGGLAGDEIPVLSRILAVADTYDAMTSDRPYRTGLGHGAAIEEIVRCSGTQFDAESVEAFLRLYEDTAPEFPDFPSGLKELAEADALRGR